MNDNVVDFPGTTPLDIPVERALNGAIDAGLLEVFVIGIDPNGALYTACSSGDTGRLLLLLERAKARVMTHVL